MTLGMQTGDQNEFRWKMLSKLDTILLVCFRQSNRKLLNFRLGVPDYRGHEEMCIDIYVNESIAIFIQFNSVITFAQYFSWVLDYVHLNSVNTIVS